MKAKIITAGVLLTLATAACSSQPSQPAFVGTTYNLNGQNPNQNDGLSTIEPSPAPSTTGPFVSQTLLNYSGKDNSSLPYNVPATGNYSVYWSFSGNTGQVTFTEIDPDGSSVMPMGGLPAGTAGEGASGSGMALINDDSGLHTLSIQCTCHWTVRIATEP